MPAWVTALLFAVLVATIPYTIILKIMLQLPKPLALSHRRWPLPVNFGVIGAVTAYTTIFIRSNYYSRASSSAAVLMEFVIVALVYIFGLALILRQFAGVYPEYIVTTGWTGLSIRKTAYRNIIDIQEVSRTHGEARLRVETNSAMVIPLTLPTRYLAIFYERLKPQL